MITNEKQYRSTKASIEKLAAPALPPAFCAARTDFASAKNSAV